MESLKKELSKPLDLEWMELMKLAKTLGFSKKEIAEFIASYKDE